MSAMEHPSEPDPRFTLANERTFLAWIRTCLALIAGGVALAELGARVTGPVWLRTTLSVIPLVAGSGFAVLAHVHWQSCRRALQKGDPLPPPRFAIGLTLLVVVVGTTLAGVIVARHG